MKFSIRASCMGNLLRAATPGRLHAVAILVLACCAAPVHAQPHLGAALQAQSSAVEAVLTQMLVTFENGSEVLKPINGIKPGDLIEYRVVYINRSTQPVRDVQATLPIPQGLEYQARSAQPSQTVEAAVRGGSFGREPLMRNLANGKTQAIPTSEYRSLRWSIPQIPASGRVEVQARARVSSVTSLPSSEPAIAATR
ncbi:MAG: DUF11 domain-containing protein [Betaproteobacteria bacterium]|nr:DUF11 domain-containing protein [Betaproteobacteria bacterium]